MQTEIITITDVKAQQADLARAGKVLRGGGLVAFPTETVSGSARTGSMRMPVRASTRRRGARRTIR